MLRAKPDPEGMTNVAGEASTGIHRHPQAATWRAFGLGSLRSTPVYHVRLGPALPVLIRAGAIALVPNPSTLGR